ncbi:MAG: VTT domain-containing protein [Acidobacteriota bacterium]
MTAPGLPPDDTSAPPARRGRLPRRLIVRAALLGLVVVGAFVALRFTPLRDHLTLEAAIALFEGLRAQWWSPLLLMSAFAVVGSVGMPVSPLVAAGGVVFGIGFGTLYNTIGLVLGAAAAYAVARWAGRELVVHLAGDKLRKAEAAFERHGFWPLVQVRFVPLPFSIVNYAAALAGVRPVRFLVASAIGLGPSTLMHTYFAHRLVYATNAQRPGILALYVGAIATLALLSSLPTLHVALRQRRLRRRLAQGLERDEPPA